MNRPWLAPLVPLYAAGLALRELRLRGGGDKVRRLRWPVVSVGNLSTGGAGKTPLAIALARMLAEKGIRVDVLSRGYGRGSSLPGKVDLAGTAQQFGDEPLLIARQAGVPVYVAPRRYDAGLLAEAEASDAAETPQDEATASRPRHVGQSREVRVHILDDGFQHRQLHRDVDVVLLDREDCNDSLLPAGNLRETLHALQRASVVAIPADDASLETDLRARGWQGPVWRIRRRMDVPTVTGPIYAFCGIARPEQFFAGLAAGLQMAGRLAFRDHHCYTATDLDRIRTMARDSGAAALVTTEKDEVRLGALAATLAGAMPLHTVPLRIEIEDEPAALEWLLSRFALEP